MTLAQFFVRYYMPVELGQTTKTSHFCATSIVRWIKLTGNPLASEVNEETFTLFRTKLRSHQVVWRHAPSKVRRLSKFKIHAHVHFMRSLLKRLHELLAEPPASS